MLEKTFLRKPKEKQPLKKKAAEWLLNYAKSQSKKGIQIPEWINRNGFLEFSIKERANFLELTDWRKSDTFDPVKYVFLDFFRVEDVEVLSNNILRLRKKGKIHTSVSSNDVSGDIDKKIGRLENIYRGGASGLLLTLEPDDIKYDYIDYVNIHFQKTEKSFIILIIEVFPSKKFIESYHDIFQGNSFTTQELSFNSFKDVYKQRSLVYTVSTAYKFPVDKIYVLYNDLNFQIKDLLKDSTEVCFYASQTNVDYPYMAVYKYDFSQFSYYKDELRNRNGVSVEMSYITDSGNVLISDREASYSKEWDYPLSIVFDKNCEKDQEKTNIHTIKHMSVDYVNSLASYWLTISYVQYLKDYVAFTRNKIFRYLYRGIDTIYLNKSINLKKDLLEKWVILKRLNHDMRPSNNMFYQVHILSRMSKMEIKRYTGMSDTIQEEIENVTNRVLDDIVKSFEEIIEIFQQTGNDNVVKSNMIIQKRVIWLTILSIAVSLYGANKDWVHNLLVKMYTQSLNLLNCI